MPRGGMKATTRKPSRQEHGADDAAGGEEDRISALPDAVLQHALGFLPSRDAVRTCVLGRRWANLWRAVPRVRVTDVPALGGSDRLDLFVNRLLLLRDARTAALDEFEIDLSTLGDRPCPRYVDLWVRHALLLGARAMRVCLSFSGDYFWWRCVLWDRPLVSTCLKVLRIDHVCTKTPDVLAVLEDIEITSGVFMSGCTFISPSAKRLCFVKCFFGINESPYDRRSCVSAKSLVWLKIEECTGLVPVLGCMPSLKAASIGVGCTFEDQCQKPCSPGSCCDKKCLNCDKHLADLMDGCVLLKGLSNATSLRFRASVCKFTFKMDLKWCPTFCNLRIFSFVDWCLAGDLGALLSFLRHTPNLEKLTLHVCQRKKCALEAQNYSPTEQLIELRQLNIFEIKYVKIDERVQRISELIFSILGTSNLKQCNIQTI